MNREALAAALVAGTVVGLVAAASLTSGCHPHAVYPPKQFDPHGSDPKALAVVDSMVGAMGGWDAWHRVAQLKWEYVVDNGGDIEADVLHAWDRSGGRHTMEEWFGKQLIVVMQQIPDFAEGYVSIGAQQAGSDEADPLLAEAETRFQTESYSLVAPFKLRDPGVHVRYVGTTPLEDQPDLCDVIAVTFDPGTGPTPKDRYWYFVDQRTHLPVRWDYVLQEELDNNDTGAPVPRTGAIWRKWRKVGPIELSLIRTFIRGAVEVRFKNVQASEKVDDDLFVPNTTYFESAFGTGTPTMPTGPMNGGQIIE